jgi:hypothetical protein
VCIDELDIYDGDVKKIYRTFRVSSKITAINSVKVKMTQPDNGAEVFTRQVPIPNSIDYNNGTFRLFIWQCMPFLWEGEDVPEIFDVYASGTFINATTPLSIIKYILEKYENILYTKKNYNISEIENELGALQAIGFVLDKPKKIFDIISDMQTASGTDFQFQIRRDLFTARLDDNSRAAALTIRINDILNINDVEIDMNNDLYATMVDIGYNKEYRNNQSIHYINEDYRMEIKNRNNYDKNYINETYMYSETEARIKGIRFAEFFRDIHPSIGNIKIKSINGLRLYDIVNIDLRVQIEDRNKISMFAGVMDAGFNMYDRVDGTGFAVSPAWKNETKYREFGGVVKAKVMSIEHDTVMGIMTLGVTKL